MRRRNEYQASGVVTPKPVRPLRTAIVVDSPNLGRSVEAERGKGFEVDWFALMQIGLALGEIVNATVVVNAGCPVFLVRKIEKAGFICVRGVTSRDCDDRVVVELAQVAASNVVDAIVLGSGDHAYVPAMRLASLTAKRLFVVSTPGSCAAALRATATRFIPIPVREKATAHKTRAEMLGILAAAEVRRCSVYS